MVYPMSMVEGIREIIRGLENFIDACGSGNVVAFLPLFDIDEGVLGKVGLLEEFRRYLSEAFRAIARISDGTVGTVYVMFLEDDEPRDLKEVGRELTDADSKICKINALLREALERIDRLDEDDVHKALYKANVATRVRIIVLTMNVDAALANYVRTREVSNALMAKSSGVMRAYEGLRKLEAELERFREAISGGEVHDKDFYELLERLKHIGEEYGITDVSSTILNMLQNIADWVGSGNLRQDFLLAIIDKTLDAIRCHIKALGDKLYSVIDKLLEMNEIAERLLKKTGE